MPRRGNKPVIYLDQNWISEITKSQIVGRFSKDDTFYSHLSSVLHTGVSEGKFACPTSEFHHTEASFNPNLRAPISFVVGTLSRGLSFNSYIEVNHKQLLTAALEFAGQDVPRTHWWHIPFNRDPDILVQQSPDFSSREHPIMVEYMKEVKQTRDSEQASLYRKFKSEAREEGHSYEEAVRLGRVQMFRELHFGVTDAVEQGFFKTSQYEPLFTEVGKEALRRYYELEWICNHGGGIAMFLESCQFSNTPFLSTFANLRAADMVRFPNRVPEPSLLTDFHFVALVIPYADMLATENYLAELIKQTGLDKEYGCHVYKMKQKDDFLDELQGM